MKSTRWYQSCNIMQWSLKKYGTSGHGQNKKVYFVAKNSYDKQIMIFYCLINRSRICPTTPSFHRNFASMKKHVIEQTRKALFSLYRKIRNLNLSILHLYDHTILPILTYVCEVWGSEIYQQLINIYHFFKTNTRY